MAYTYISTNGCESSRYLDPLQKPNFFDNCKLSKYLTKDIRSNIIDYKKLKRSINDFRPNILFHLAAQSSVLESYKHQGDLETNIIGTSNILHILKDIKSIKSAIIAQQIKFILIGEEEKFKEMTL